MHRASAVSVAESRDWKVLRCEEGKRKTHVLRKALTIISRAWCLMSSGSEEKNALLVPETSCWMSCLGTSVRMTLRSSVARLRKTAPATERPRVRPLSWAG